MGYDPFSGDHAAQQLWPTSRQRLELPAEVQPLELPEDREAFEQQAKELAAQDVGDYRNAPPILNAGALEAAVVQGARRINPRGLVGPLLVILIALAAVALLVVILSASVR